MRPHCDYCGGLVEDNRHVLPTARCWTHAEEPALEGATRDRWLYQAGWRIGRDQGDAQGFRRGYVYGYSLGEQHTRLSDDSFVDAIARRIRELDYLEAAVSEVVRSTNAGLAALAYRARKRGEVR